MAYSNRIFAYYLCDIYGGSGTFWHVQVERKKGVKALFINNMEASYFYFAFILSLSFNLAMPLYKNLPF
jgi:hypothetical protein